MAAKKKKNIIKMQCKDCKNVNYWSMRAKTGATVKKLELAKFCKHCRKHTTHKEGKK